MNEENLLQLLIITRKIKYAEHLKLRISVRKFPENYPILIYKDPDSKFLDVLEKTKISMKRLKYMNKIRNIMIAYEEDNSEVRIITIHPIADEKVLNRIMSGRWIKNE